MKKSIWIAAALMLFGFAGTSFAEIKVVSVKGTVAYSKGDRWTPVTSGMKLSEGMKISTGVKSQAVLQLANSTVTVKPLSMMKIYEDRLSSEESSTSVGLRRGSVKAEVNRMRTVKTVFKIATPVATSSVRGTIQEVAFGHFGVSYSVPEGSVQMTGKNGENRVLSNNLTYSQSVDAVRPADNMMGNSVVSLVDNISADEIDSMNQNGADVPDTPGGVVDSFNAVTANRATSLRMNVTLNIPQGK